MDLATALKNASSALADAAELADSGDESEDSMYLRLRHMQDEVDEMVAEISGTDED